MVAYPGGQVPPPEPRLPPGHVPVRITPRMPVDQAQAQALSQAAKQAQQTAGQNDTSIKNMVQWALSKVGCSYTENSPGRCGPNSFDCSGLVYESCVNNGIRPPGGTAGGCSDTFIQWPDNSSNGNTLIPGGGPFVAGDLLYFNNGAGGAQPGHTGIAISATQMVNALNTQYGVITCDITWGGTVMGAIRLPGSTGSTGGAGTSGAGGNSTSGSGTSQSTTGQTWQQEVAQQQSLVASLPDPRDNLPFSKYFQQMAVPPANNLVRGGIVDLTTKQFKCYFMMNPQQISMGSNIDTSNLTSPLQQDPSVMQYGGYWVTNQTVSFTLYFNRMYEVWQGGITGPSDIGCRWDIRALERLIGIFDASTKGGASVGMGTYGAGGYPPMTYPLQVVFGGDNSYQFQGVIASLDWYYTLFSNNMIPIEAYADVSIMRIYQPSMSSPDLVNNLPMTASVGKQYLAAPTQVTKPFNLKKGTG